MDYEGTRKRRKTASLRMRRERNEGRGDAGQAGPSHLRTYSGSVNIQGTGQVDSPATTDTNDSNKHVTSESEMEECIKDSNDDDLTNCTGS